MSAGPTSSARPPRFTIPMRGNEDCIRWLERHGHAVFTIPMRGNEEFDPWDDLADREVYDPHEG